jgi:hypothetical protein
MDNLLPTYPDELIDALINVRQHRIGNIDLIIERVRA